MAENYTFRSAMNGFHRGDVIAYLEKLMNENTELRTKTAALEAETQAQLQEIEALKAQLGEAEKKNAGGERVDTALLGAAMYDARRFSDLIVGEANDAASQMFSDAAAAAQDAGTQADALAADTAALAEKMRDTLSAVETALADLREKLLSFHDGVENDNAAFLEKFSKEAAEKFEREKAAEG